MGFAVLSDASSSARSSFFPAPGTIVSALSAAISFLICSGGSVNFLVCGSMPDMIIKIFIPRVVIFGEARKAVLLGNSLGLRLHLRIIRFVRIRALVELRHVLMGGHDPLNVLLGELDLLRLLRSGRAGIKQSESQKRREQRTQKPPTISNDRHAMLLRLDHRFELHNFGRGMTPNTYANVMRFPTGSLRSQQSGAGKRE